MAERSETIARDGIGLGVSARFENQQLFENARALVACEADLYNADELIRLAGDAGSAREQGAASLMASLFARFGISFVEKLHGDFAVVLWDKLERRLFAAVDEFSIHPLVYYRDSHQLIVASRIDALLACGEVAREIRPEAIATYLNYTVNLAPQTFFAGIERMLPGTILEASSPGDLRTRRYWDMAYPCDGGNDEEKLARELESVVEESVRVRCADRADQGLGAFLSGGTDSSTVVGMMSRAGCNPVKTFSIGFAEERFNELEYARITARKFNAAHHEYLVTAADCVAALPDMVRSFDEPYGNSSAIPTYFCARLAAENGVRALLAGDGGDELFAGNERYLTDRIFSAYHNTPAFVRRGMIEPALNAIPARNGLVRMARSYVRRANLPQPDRFFSYNLLLDNPLGAIFEPDFLASVGNFSVLERPRAYYCDGPAKDHLNRLLYLDLKITLADNDLLKVTRMSELAGIRTRFPFLDRSVAELSGRIPPDLKLRGTQKRYLFKRAFRNLLPPEVLTKKKHGFGIPVAFWMKSDARMREISHDTLLAPRTYQRGIVRREFIEDLLRRHESDTTPFYGDTLWTFLTLELWFREFVDVARKAVA